MTAVPLLLRLLGLVLLLLPFEAAASRAYFGRDVYHRLGDDPRWAAADWDDRDWVPNNEVPTRQSICWVRRHFWIGPDHAALMSDDPVPLLPPAEWRIDSIYIAAPYSYEIYWDGRLVGKSGRVGRSRAEELTGPLDNVFMVPVDLLAEGEHVVAIRLSSFHYNFPADRVGVGFYLVNSAQHHASEAARPAFPLVGLGGALLVGIISLLLFWFAGRWRPLLLCGVISFAVSVFYLLIALRWLGQWPYEWFYPRLLATTGMIAAIAVLFPWLLLEQFGFARARRAVLLMLPLLVAAWMTSPIYEIKALWICRAMLAASALIAAWAVWKGRPSARIVLLTAVAGLVLVRSDRRDFLDPSFFVIFGVLMLVVFASLGLQLQAARRRSQEAVLNAARLQTELLKKNIQPHFLMNTLTTVMEVVEQDPKTAVQLIDALAGEFRILARVAGEKLIPLGQELELCRAHLEIMSLRRGVAATLEVYDADQTSPVPPALFHTLIEGGLTHQIPRDGRLRFTLDAAYQPGWARYALVVHGGNPPATVPPLDGTGYRYVKARLEESYPGRWTFHAGPVEAGWQSVIEIRFPPGESGSP